MIFNETKTKIKEDIISAARLYGECFLNYSYLLCSPVFHTNPYYIVVANKRNFKHLTGVHSVESPIEFYDKAYDGVLSEDDFEFVRERCTEKQALKCTRDKLSVFSDMTGIFKRGTIVEEGFEKNQIRCLFAAGDSMCTIGFAKSSPVQPMTLLKGNKLDPERSGPLELVLRKPKTSDLFDEIVLGDGEALSKYYNDIKSLLAPDIRLHM